MTFAAAIMKIRVPFFWCAALWLSASAVRAEQISTSPLEPTWTKHLVSGNGIETADGSLKFSARANTITYVEHGLSNDLIRVSCALKSAAAPALLGLHWDESNFLQFGLNAPVGGKLNVREVLGTYPHDYEFARNQSEWQFVAIELARDCIRYLTSRDGKTFETIQVRPRPERFSAAPKLLVVGAEIGGKIFARPSPWLAKPSTETVNTAWVRDMQVEPLEKAKSTATSAERRQLVLQERDLIGEQELAAAGDPTFDSVSQHLPAMKWSREVVGVKDHPFDIGVAPDGSLQLNNDIASYKNATAHFEINGYRFGSQNVSCKKSLQNGWMPIVSMCNEHDGLQIEQTVFGWTKNFSADEPLLGLVQINVRNVLPRTNSVSLSFVINAASNAPAPLKWQFDLAANEEKNVFMRVPYDILKSSAEEISAEEFHDKLAATESYWNKLIAERSRFEIPEPRVQNAYRAWLAYNFLNVARRNGVDEVCDGSGFYGKVYGYSAALYCNALDLMGYHSLAGHYCDALLSFAHTNGLLAVNFGDTDTGTALWVIAEHFRLTRDTDWLRQRAPQMRKMCEWIIEQRHAALANADKEPAVTRGLIRYRPYADLLHPAADYFSNGYLWKGLDATAKVFAEAGIDGGGDAPGAKSDRGALAARNTPSVSWRRGVAATSCDEASPPLTSGLQREADAYFKDIQASMNSAVFTDHGQKILPMIPDSHELWKESDGSADGYYGIIAPCLLEIGLPAVDDQKSKLITDTLEQRGGLVAGVAQFHRMADHAYTYGYWLNCLQRDDMKRAILGLYGSLAYGMSRDTYAAVECTSIQTGENYWMLPHTYSNTQQLRLLRNMLVREDGDSLWLGQAIPRDWLAPGKRVAVNDAPTTFGPVSYAIEPNSDGSMNVKLSPSTRQSPKEILLRVREPNQRRIARVKTTGTAKVKFSGETIRLSEISSPIAMEVFFRE